MPTTEEILRGVQERVDAEKGMAGKPGIGALGQALQNDPFYIKSIMQALLSGASAIRPGGGAMPPGFRPRPHFGQPHQQYTAHIQNGVGTNPYINRWTSSQVVPELNRMPDFPATGGPLPTIVNPPLHRIHSGPHTAQHQAVGPRQFLGSGMGNLDRRTMLRPRTRGDTNYDAGEMPLRGPSDRQTSPVTDIVRRHYSSRSSVNRPIAPPEMPVTPQNLIPMMDRHGLSLSRTSGHPYRTQYFTFTDRQGFLPLQIRNRSGRPERVLDPRYTVRIPHPADVHAAPIENIMSHRGDAASASMGRYFDTAWEPGRIPNAQGRIPTPERSLNLDRFGRTLGDIRNLEGELVNRHFPLFRRPSAAANRPRRERRDPRQLDFFDMLGAVRGE